MRRCCNEGSGFSRFFGDNRIGAQGMVLFLEMLKVFLQSKRYVVQPTKIPEGAPNKCTGSHVVSIVADGAGSC